MSLYKREYYLVIEDPPSDDDIKSGLTSLAVAGL